MNEPRDRKEKPPVGKKFDQRLLELTVIGFMTAWPEKMYELEDLSEENFGDPNCRSAFAVLKDAFDKGGAGAIGSITLCASVLTTIGGFSQDSAFAVLTEAADHMPTNPAAIVSVRDKLVAGKMRRSLRQAAVELTALADTPGATIDDLTTVTAQITTDAIRGGYRTQIHTIGDAVDEEMERLERIDSGVATEADGLKTGLDALDERIHRYHNGEMIVIGARPSMGKSSQLNHHALSMGVDQESPGVLFSLEMNKTDYARRLICNRGRVNLQKATIGAMGPNERARFNEAAAQIRKAPIWIYDVGGVSMGQIAAIIHRLVHEKGVKWAGIDYIQLVDHRQRANESMNAAITRTSTTIKATARSLNIPIIVLSQLNRECEKRDNKRPRLSDLRDSGSIEQDGDVVMFLYRESLYWTPEQTQDRCKDLTETAEIIVAKQRNGPIGIVKVQWVRESASFANLSDQTEGQPTFGQYDR